MPRIIRYNTTSNTNASEVTKRSQARTIFADALVTQKTLDLACLNRVVSGPAPTTSYSGSKPADQRLGAVYTTLAQKLDIVASSPCAVPPPPPAPIVYPNYELTCSDPLGIQIMATGTFTSFTFTTTSLGAGVIDFQFFLNNVFQSNELNVLGVDSNLITPPSEIDEVRYVFKCNPLEVTLYCADPAMVLQWTIPYSFFNPPSSELARVLTLYKHPISEGITEIHTVEIGETFTPTPAWGWDFATIDC